MPRSLRGFTLIELILVIIVLSVLALGTTGFIADSAESYRVSADRAKLIASGRVAVEKVTRRLRNALPNSIRLSSDGRCIEYFPVLVASSTVGLFPVPATMLATAPFTLVVPAVTFAVIAPFAPEELYVSGTPSPSVIALTSLMPTPLPPPSPLPVLNTIDLGSSHSFLRTSPTDRVYLVGQPQRFCVDDGELLFYTGYGIVPPELGSTAIIAGDVPSGATSSLIAENVDLAGLTPFQYSPGTLVRNALVEVTLNFLNNGDPVRIAHEVQIRNVP